MVKEAEGVVGRGGAGTARQLRRGAAQLFWKNGYAATTIRELAELIGVQKASLYYHIAGKEDLLYDICVESLGNIHDAVVEALANESDALARVHVMIEAHVASMLDDKEKHATMLTELKSLSPARREAVVGLRDGYEKLARAVISDAQEAGVLRSDMSAKELQLGLFNLLNWTIFWYRTDGDLSPGQVSGLLKSLYLDGALSE
ncbi:MAG: TetR/AcrR family transcriptional regulator [Rubrobacteraceae bacterium]